MAVDLGASCRLGAGGSLRASDDRVASPDASLHSQLDGPNVGSGLPGRPDPADPEIEHPALL